MTADQLARLWERLGIPPEFARRCRSRIQRTPRRLVAIGRARDDGRILRLTPRAAAAWRRLDRAARAAGIELLPLSAFRSVARQTAVFRRKLAAGQAIDAILRVNAAPGCSEHHTGRAIDFGTPSHLFLESTFARTAAFRWLRREGARFGFHLSYPRNNPQGIVYEPWHWCWRPARLQSRQESA